jgi:hypothetical protein
MPEDVSPKWPLPEVGNTIPQNTINLEHPEYIARKYLWEFFRHSDELTGGYKPSVETFTAVTAVPSFDETYLIPHIRETDQDFKRRVAAAKPPRFVREGIESITGVLTEQPPNRDAYPEPLKEWSSRVNADGDSLQQWITHADLVSQARISKNKRRKSKRLIYLR